MNIGDKVRFLNAVGGGRITGFPDKNLVLVCDDDGFEVPTLRSEIVVVETDNYNFQRAATSSKAAEPVAEIAPTSIKAALSRHHSADQSEEDDVDPADLNLTFRARPLERRGGDQLNLFLGFLPIDTRQLTTTRFEAYLINDSNYAVRFALMTQRNALYWLRHEGVVPPNQKLLLETFGHDDLPEWERLTLQAFAFKEERGFALKPAFNLTLRVDGTKFYKLHTFGQSDFFHESVLLFDLVRDDRPADQVRVAPDELRDALLTPASKPAVSPARPADRGIPSARATDRNAIIEVDLHAAELLDSTSGMEPRDILMCQIRAFHETMKAHAKERGRRIVFIHGKGEGVLRQEVLKELKRYYPRCTHQDASFREYGFGATMVTIH